MDYDPQIDPAGFTTRIDNRFLPLVPGTAWVYEGETDEGLERIEVTVAHETRTVMGVETVVVRDTVRLDGEVIEDTYDWYAQDASGNVWYFGEDSKEYEGGRVVSTGGSWEAGVDGAKPGIVMSAKPAVGQSYRQEYYRGEAEDMAEVIGLDGSASVSFGSYDGLLVTREWTPLERGVAEEKLYAAGIGLVLERMVEGGSDVIELVSLTR